MKTTEKQQTRSTAGEIAVLVLSSGILLLMFSAPPLKPTAEFRCFSDSASEGIKPTAGFLCFLDRACEPIKDLYAESSTDSHGQSCKAASVFVPSPNDNEITKAYIKDTPAVLAAEVLKVNEEIQMRIEQENTWYDYKFAIIGSLLSAVLLFAAYKGINTEERIDELLRSNPACTVMALGSVFRLWH